MSADHRARGWDSAYWRWVNGEIALDPHTDYAFRYLRELKLVGDEAASPEELAIRESFRDDVWPLWDEEYLRSFCQGKLKFLIYKKQIDLRKIFFH